MGPHITSHPDLRQTSVEEMIASTAYLELFVRSVAEPALLRAFLRFILLHRHDGATILDTLVARLGTNSRVSPVLRGMAGVGGERGHGPNHHQPGECPGLAWPLPQACPSSLTHPGPGGAQPQLPALTGCGHVPPALHGVAEPLPDTAESQLRGCHVAACAQVRAPNPTPHPGAWLCRRAACAQHLPADHLQAAAGRLARVWCGRAPPFVPPSCGALSSLAIRALSRPGWGSGALGRGRAWRWCRSGSLFCAGQAGVSVHIGVPAAPQPRQGAAITVSRPHRYLIPCSHVMLSQRRAVKDLDLYGRSAAKFLSLIPRCCHPESLPPPDRDEEHATWAKGTAWTPSRLIRSFPIRPGHTLPHHAVSHFVTPCHAPACPLGGGCWGRLFISPRPRSWGTAEQCLPGPCVPGPAPTRV